MLLLSGLSFGQDNLYCTTNSYRDWWDVQHYTIVSDINPRSKQLKGNVSIIAKVATEIQDTLQIDLEKSLEIDRIYVNGTEMTFIKGERAQLIPNIRSVVKDSVFMIDIQYSGRPIKAVKPPWDGGLVFKKDSNGKPWIAVACQGDGASVWWPCKDDPSDEPDLGVDLHLITKKNLSAIGNGRLVSRSKSKRKFDWHWKVVNPINLYDVTFYIGDYVHWSDSIDGEKGTLSLDYYVLKDNLEKAKSQFDVVPEMIHCFEDWFGPYPFYEDGYKLVESPYLGMEHQSAIAYGNEYQMGYLGSDRSATGVGLLFDFIIVHESGHEWFGNNISINDVAYSWVHEGFTTYSETIFAECHLGIDSAFQYQHGQWRNIANRTPMEGKPGECDGGSSDHYAKGAALVHMIRTIMQNDEKFKDMLRTMSEKFYHQTVTGIEIENFINEYSGINFNHVYEQYLRTKQIPILLFKWEENGNQFKWSNCIDNFNMPIKLTNGSTDIWIQPSTEWQDLDPSTTPDFKVSSDFYIKVKP